MKCWVFSRDFDSVGLRWGVLELLGEELASVDGEESGSWCIPSDLTWSSNIQEVSGEIEGDSWDFQELGKLIILLIILPAVSLLRFLIKGTSFCAKDTHLSGTNLPRILRDSCINYTPKSVLNPFIIVSLLFHCPK